MAQSYQCDLCHAVAADYMITRIQDGTVLAIGVECLLDFAMPVAEAYLEAQARDEASDHPTEAEVPAGAAEWEEGYPQPDTQAGDSFPESTGTGEGVEAESSDPADVSR